jgi:hypothetical protein
VDGTDRAIVLGHATLKSIMGIDDSADRFVINTDASFDGTIADNDFSIDASGNVYIKGDLTVTGNNITFGNGESVYNTVDNKIGLTTNASGGGTFEVLSAGATNMLVKSATADARISLIDGASTKWSIGYDYDDSGKLKIDTGAAVGGATKITLDTSGNLTVAGTITGGTQPNWTVTNKTGTSRALDCDGGEAAIGDRLGQLIDDLITIGILT